MNGRGGDRGAVALEFALAVCVLLLPSALLVLTLPTWLEHAAVARLAAQEAARTVVLADDADRGRRAAVELAEGIARRHGIDPAALDVTFGGTLAWGEIVEARAALRLPGLAVPGIGTFGGFTWTARHREAVDRYRSW